MTPGIDPKVDYAFKRVFGSEANADLLQDLLESVLGFAVASVQIVNPFNEKETDGDKLSVLDIRAKDADGRSFAVEMQMVAHAALVDRILYYWAKLYASQLGEGESFTKLRPAYAICFVNRQLFDMNPNEPLNRFDAVNVTTGELLSDHLSLTVVELPKFATAAEQVGTPFERWCYYFQHAATLDPERLPATLDRPPLRKAMEVLMRMSQSETERARYESRLMYKRDMEQFETDVANARADLAKAQADAAKAQTDAAKAQADAAKAQADAEKAQADAEKVRVDAAQSIDKGIKEGMQRGALHGEIRGIQRAFGQPATPDEELTKLSLDDLKLLVERLIQHGSSGK